MPGERFFIIYLLLLLFFETRESFLGTFLNPFREIRKF